MRLVFQLVVDQAAVFLEGVAQRGGRASAGLAMAFGDLLFELGQHLAHRLAGASAHFRVDLRARGALRGGRALAGGCRHAALGAQLVGPHRHRRQRRGGVGRSGHGLHHGGLERVPHHQQLRPGGIHLRREFHVHTGPVAVSGDRIRLRLPVPHVVAQHLQRGLRIAPGLGRQHLDTLGQQHGGLALHLHAVLQVFDAAHAVGQAGLEPGQRLARERRAGLGGVALPGHRVGDVELGRFQQGLAFGAPFGGQRLLALGAFEFVELFAHRLGGALVATAEFAEHLLQLLGRGVAGQPVADARGALARGGCGEGATGQGVKKLEVERFGSGLGHGRRFGRELSETPQSGVLRQSGIFAGIYPAG